MRALVLALLPFAVLCVAPTAYAQVPPAPEMSKRLCDAIAGRESVLRVLREYAGAKAGASNDPVARAKVRQFTDARYKLGRAQSGLFCDDLIPGFKGNLFRAALAIGEDQALWGLARSGLDPNVPDSLTGKTALDEVVELIDRRLQTDEVAEAPYTRLAPTAVSGEKPYRRTLLRLMRNYEMLREAGAKLKGERELALSDCNAGPADTPKPGSVFDGKFFETGSGPTPAQIPGVATVSARQAACLLDYHGGKMLRLAVLKDEAVVPGSYDFAFASAKGSFDDKVQAVVADDLNIYTRLGQERDRPILVYCHHEQCRLSYNAILRIKAAGYENIYWMREGLEAWVAAGYPTGGLIATHQPLRPFEKH